MYGLLESLRTRGGLWSRRRSSKRMAIEIDVGLMIRVLHQVGVASVIRELAGDIVLEIIIGHEIRDVTNFLWILESRLGRQACLKQLAEIERHRVIEFV